MTLVIDCYCSGQKQGENENGEGPVSYAGPQMFCTCGMLSGSCKVFSVQHEMQVRWQGRDAEGRPLLVVKVAQACQECSSTAAEELSHVITSQVTLSLSALCTAHAAFTISAEFTISPSMLRAGAFSRLCCIGRLCLLWLFLGFVVGR